MLHKWKIVNKNKNNRQENNLKNKNSVKENNKKKLKSNKENKE